MLSRVPRVGNVKVGAIGCLGGSAGVGEGGGGKLGRISCRRALRRILFLGAMAVVVPS